MTFLNKVEIDFMLKQINDEIRFYSRVIQIAEEKDVILSFWSGRVSNVFKLLIESQNEAKKIKSRLENLKEHN